MSNFDDLWGGFCVMLTLCVMGLILSMFGGYLADNLWKQFDLAGAVDLNDNWRSIGTQNMALNIYYLVCCLFPVVGIASFIKTVIRRQGYNNYIMN